MTSVTRFVGSIPELYDRHMGPVLFEPYARDLADRVPVGTKRILEIAAGTGRVTRQLLRKLPADGELVATDLNEPMIEIGKKQVGADPRLTWQQANMVALPFPDGSFDMVACQFGLMFVPAADKQTAVREMRRVLRPGGIAIVSVWDHLDRNPASKQLHEIACAAMPDNPPAFMLTPFSMPDPNVLRSLADGAGFSGNQVQTVELVGESTSADDLAIGLVRGNPLWTQIVERGLDADALQAKVTETLARSWGQAPCRSPVSAHVLTAFA